MNYPIERATSALINAYRVEHGGHIFYMALPGLWPDCNEAAVTVCAPPGWQAIGCYAEFDGREFWEVGLIRENKTGARLYDFQRLEDCRSVRVTPGHTGIPLEEAQQAVEFTVQHGPFILGYSRPHFCGGAK